MLLLRGYERGDLDAMYALDVVCFAPPFRFTRSAMRRFAEARKALVVVAESSGDLAGFCIVHRQTTENTRLGYIVTLDVAPGYRRQGLARRMILEAERQVAAAGGELMALHVFSGNAQAIAFYRALGYTASQRESGFYGVGRDAFVYLKPLVVSRPPSLRRTGEHAIQ